MVRPKVIAGNWKMHLTPSEAGRYARRLRAKLLDTSGVPVILCPPFLALRVVFDVVKDSAIKVGAQNMHDADQGAFTGEISAPMLKESGAEYVILGHSERRHLFGEDDEFIERKVHQALRHGLKPILCVGETLAEREGGDTRRVVLRQIETALRELTAEQMQGVLVAYEPVWAIGTGHTATPEQAEEVHRIIREWIAEHKGAETAERQIIMYGGSVKAHNALELLRQPDIDGALVGGASLKAEEFAAIIRAALEASEV